jgi:hypothetical protein
VASLTMALAVAGVGAAGGGAAGTGGITAADRVVSGTHGSAGTRGKARARDRSAVRAIQRTPNGSTSSSLWKSATATSTSSGEDRSGGDTS